MRMSMPLPPGPIRFEPPPSSPPSPDPWEREIAFISGVAANATVAAISYGSWGAAGALDPPTYDPTVSDSFKWGDTTLSPSGAANLWPPELGAARRWRRRVRLPSRYRREQRSRPLDRALLRFHGQHTPGHHHLGRRREQHAGPLRMVGTLDHQSQSGHL